MPRDLKIKTTFQSVDKSTRVIGKIQSKMMRFTASTAMGLRKIDRAISKVSGAMTSGLKVGIASATAGSLALYGATSKIMREFSRIEDAEAAFTPLLGGAQKATKMVEALNTAAAKTPFQFDTLSGAAKQLLPNMGGDIQKTIDRIRMLGDAAGGDAQKMDSIVRGYNKALLKGKVDMESLNMIAEAGVPIFGDLGKVAGTSGAKLFKSISAGKVTTEQLTEAFEKMTGKGGMFYKGMEIASQTLSGKMSTLQDSVNKVVADFGSALAPSLKDSADQLTAVTENVNKWVLANKGLIKSKFETFIKKVPYYFEKTKELLSGVAATGRVMVATFKPFVPIMKVVGRFLEENPRLVGIGISSFYALSGAVKVASVSMQTFNTMTKINLAPVKKLGQYFDKILPGKIGASSNALRGFGKGIGLIGAAFATYEIGKLIYENFVDPMIRANKELDRLKGKIEETKKKGLSNLNAPQLQTEKKRAEKALNLEKGLGKKTGWLMATSTGMGAGFGVLQYDKAQTARENELKKYGAQVQSAIVRRRDIDIARSPMSDEWSTSTQMVKEQVEITIKDETGRARITKGRRGGRLKLAHTGGMP